MSLRNNIDKKKGEKDKGRISCYTGNDPNEFYVKQILSNNCTSFSTPATIFGQDREVLARNVYSEKIFLIHYYGIFFVKKSKMIFKNVLQLQLQGM